LIVNKSIRANYLCKYEFEGRHFALDLAKIFPTWVTFNLCETSETLA